MGGLGRVWDYKKWMSYSQLQGGGEPESKPPTVKEFFQEIREPFPQVVVG
jgi:hypothetical protein